MVDRNDELKEMLEDLNESATGVLDELIELESQVDQTTFEARWSQATKLRSLAENRTEYGETAFKTAYLAMGYQLRWAEQQLAVARKFTKKEIDEYAEKVDGNRRRFTWTHLLCLLPVDSKGTRKSLVSAWAKEGWTTDEFAEAVRRKIAPDSSEAGEGASSGAEPTTAPAKAIKTVLKVMTKLNEVAVAVASIDYTKIPIADVTQLITLTKSVDAVEELVSTLRSQFPREKLEDLVKQHQESAAAVLGTAPTTPTTTVTEETPSGAAADDDDIFGKVGKATATDDLVPVRPTKPPKRGGKAKAAKAKGPAQDKRR